MHDPGMSAHMPREELGQKCHAWHMSQILVGEPHAAKLSNNANNNSQVIYNPVVWSTVLALTWMCCTETVKTSV